MAAIVCVRCAGRVFVCVFSQHCVVLPELGACVHICVCVFTGILAIQDGTIKTLKSRGKARGGFGGVGARGRGRGRGRGKAGRGPPPRRGGGGGGGFGRGGGGRAAAGSQVRVAHMSACTSVQMHTHQFKGTQISASHISASHICTLEPATADIL